MNRSNNQPPKNRSRRDQGSNQRSQRPAGGRPNSRGPRTNRPRLEVVQKNQDRFWIYGLHSVRAALVNKRRATHRLLATQDVMAEIEAHLSARPDLKRDVVGPDGFKTLLPRDAVHQGVAVEVSALPHVPLEPLLASPKPMSTLLVLDQVTDPRNFGAILRSAVAFKATAVVVPERNSAELNGVTAKAASGALDMISIVHTVNLARAFEQMKAAGYWIVGLDADADEPLQSYERPPKTAIVLGSEGRGLRRLVAERCDKLLSLPIDRRIESLNVAVAAGITLHSLARE